VLFVFHLASPLSFAPMAAAIALFGDFREYGAVRLPMLVHLRIAALALPERPAR
jgi:hypothetical protein